MFINPASGSGLAIKTGKWIDMQLTKRGVAHYLFVNDWPENLDGCLEAWIVGGDGTLNYFLNKYIKLAIPLAIFKGGTGNDLFWKLHGNINREEQLHRAFTKAAKPVDAIMCNEGIFANSSGIGFDGEVLRSGKMIRAIGGHLGYLLIVLRQIFTYREPDFNITTPDKTINGKLLIVGVNNSSRTGGGFLITPAALINDGKFDVLLCDKISILKRLIYLPVIEKGKHLTLPFIQHFQETSITIECAKPLYAHLDGELVRHNKFHFRILPGYLRVKY